MQRYMSHHLSPGIPVIKLITGERFGITKDCYFKLQRLYKLRHYEIEKFGTEVLDKLEQSFFFYCTFTQRGFSKEREQIIF